MSPSKTKITVVKAFEPKDVIGKDFIRADGKPILKCDFAKQGQVFSVDESGGMPVGFCEHAWCSVVTGVDILRHGGSVAHWTGEDNLFRACSDGIRPVCFKIERVK